MENNDTIVAIATPLGCSGIGIVRMSGQRVEQIAKNVFRTASKLKKKNLVSHKMNYGFIVDTDSGEVIDEVLMVFMKAPATYTREDVVEINCHGGSYSLTKTLSLLLKNGARIAQPGEFTKRAFLNGRIDLTQAEAVIDLINSKTQASARNSLSQLQGSLAKQMGNVRMRLIGMLADIEVTNDFPEYDIEEISTKKLQQNIAEIIRDLEKILANSEKGRILKDGLNTAIVGKPNVGKSSLLNLMLGEERAIVTDIPGTTRDIIQEFLDIGGIPLKIYDTAGIRQTQDTIEKLGVERAEKVLEQAELVLFVLDGSENLTKTDRDIIEKIKNKKVIVLINKTDLGIVINEKQVRQLLPDKKILTLSVKEAKGIEQLEKEITKMFFGGKIDAEHDVMITNIRQTHLVENAKNCLEDAMAAICGNMPIDCAAIDIRNAADYLGELTGQVVTQDVVNEIFGRFCIGK